MKSRLIIRGHLCLLALLAPLTILLAQEKVDIGTFLTSDDIADVRNVLRKAKQSFEDKTIRFIFDAAGGNVTSVQLVTRRTAGQITELQITYATNDPNPKRIILDNTHRDFTPLVEQLTRLSWIQSAATASRS